MKRGVHPRGGDYGFMILRTAKMPDLDHFIKHCGMSPMESIHDDKTAVKPWTCGSAGTDP